MKNIFLGITILFCIVLNGCVNLRKDRDVLFQVSTINALMEGVYDGDVTCRQLSKHGNFGIGTFNSLDGEMVFLDNVFYQIKGDGTINTASNHMLETPFAAVTFFDPDIKGKINNELNFKQLTLYLNSLLPSQNIFYAIKIKGSFDYVKTRSVLKQAKPYHKLDEVIKNQSVFEYHNIEGYIIGFWCPEYVKGVNVPLYHFHFISKDRMKGGHLLECSFKNADLEIDTTGKFYMVLPNTEEFYKINLSGIEDKKIEEVEK